MNPNPIQKRKSREEGRIFLNSQLGKKFGKWLISEVILPKPPLQPKTLFRCTCQCGVERIIHSSYILRGTTQSCGNCTKICPTPKSAQGNASDRIFRIWHGMIQRCFNSNRTSFYNYGGRGITVCERWRVFENFVQDMGEPGEGESIDRINPNGNYCPENCRWASAYVQANNRRNTRSLEVNGRIQTVSQWSRETGIGIGTLHSRIRRGWAVERIFSEIKKPSKFEGTAGATP